MTLADADCHGYRIMQAVEDRTGGEMTLHPGTLYRTLARLLEQQAIEEVHLPDAADGSDRRRLYRLTAFGRQVAVAEAARLARQVQRARAGSLIGSQD